MKKYILITCLLFVGFLKAQEVNYTIKNLESNSKFQDFGTAFYKDSLVVFASTRGRKTIRKNVWLGNKQPFLELYQGNIGSDGELNNLQVFSEEINSKYHNSNVTFTKDYKTVYFTRNNYLNKKFKKDSLGRNLIQLYKAQVNNEGKWINIEAMPFNNDHYQTGHPVLNNDDTKLYFTSDMPGTVGLTDIFVVDLYKDGTYGTPKNLGENVNTIGKEMFPFINKDDVLFFSSDGYENGVGGLDIYANQIVNNKAVNSSINIGKPLNSQWDDFAIVYDNEKKLGYFSSNREGGKGDDDLYYFNELNPIVFECNQIVNGVVKDVKTNEVLVNASVDILDKNGAKLMSTKSNNLGGFSFELACDTSYKIIGSKETYIDEQKEVILNKQNKLMHNVILNLKPDFVEKAGEIIVNIPPIYFDFDKSNIREDATTELLKVIAIMNKYPDIIVEYRSHTDSRGSDLYNMNLSDSRAKSSARWIVENGISKSRISGKGYGETQLINKCSNGIPCTSAEHQLNRRSDFVITNPEVIK